MAATSNRSRTVPRTWRRRERLLDGPSLTVKSRPQRLRGNADFGTPGCQALCFAVVGNNTDVTGGGCKNSRYRPAGKYSGVQRGYRHIETFGPFFERMRFPITCQSFGAENASGVRRLLLVRCPAAITGCVAFLVVDPIQCRAERTVTHICDKRGEGLPARTYANTAAAVVRPAARFRIFTSLSHTDPRHEQRMTSDTAWKAFLFRRCDERSAFTAARFMVTVQQMPLRDIADLAAYATTTPMPLSYPPFRSRCLRDDHEKAEFTAKKISVSHACLHNR